MNVFASDCGDYQVNISGRKWGNFQSWRKLGYDWSDMNGVVYNHGKIGVHSVGEKLYCI